MKFGRHLKPWLLGAGLLALVAIACAAVGYAQSTPAPAPAAAAPAAPPPAPGDPAGLNTSGPLYTPNSYLTGWGSGVSKKADGSDWKSYADPAKPTPQELATNVAHAFYSINFAWTLICGFLVMFMQAGFAFLEVGFVRTKNVANTIGMNMMVYGIGMFGFFVCGFALMCGGSAASPIGAPGALGGIPVLDGMFTLKIGGFDYGIFGTTGFFLMGRSYDAAAIVWFLFMMVFMDTTATIPTGALAERWKFSSFFVFSFFIGAIIYPMYGNWLWGGGWLAQLGLSVGLGHGAVDYAGSSVVHLQGGALCFIMAAMLGPRIGKYDAKGKPKPMPAHNVPFIVLGTFILAFGWFGFNAGSSLSATDSRIGVIATNTMLASAAGSMSAILYYWFFYKKPDVSMACNGMLAGLVAITAPCAFVAPWAAFVIGLIAGVLAVVGSFFIERIGIDDSVGAIAVHGINGVWGVWALGLFADGTYGQGWNGVGYNEYMGVAGRGVTGLFYGDGKQFIAEVLTSIVCIAWNIGAGAFFFWLTGLIVGGNRVTKEHEEIGLDISQMGSPGYTGFKIEEVR
jgi:ammonium transporter, Amt family